MHVLCVLTKLPLPGSGDRKEGVYPIMLRAHVGAAIRTAVAVQSVENANELSRFCTSETIRLILSGERSSPMTLLRYLSVGLRPGWAAFAWKYRTLLEEIDRYIATEGRPDLIVGLQACSSSGKVAYLAGKRHDIPFAVRENSTLYTRKLMVGGLRSTARDVVRSAWRVLTVSQELGKSMERELGVDIPRKVTMPNPVSGFMFRRPDTCDWIAAFARSR
jgi:hypothetical protein